MSRLFLLVGLVLLLCGCASPRTPLQEADMPGDPRAEALVLAVAEALADEGGTVARRTTMEVAGVEELGDNLVFDLRIRRAESFGHPEREFIVVSRCPKAAPKTCRDNAVASMRAAAQGE